MSRRKGAVMVLGLMVVLVLAALSASFYFRTISENNLARRNAESIRAFWLAEAGVAAAIDNLPSLNTSGSIGGANHSYSAQATVVSGNLYNIISTGSVNLGSLGTITKTVNVNVETGTANPNNFPYAIETTTDLVIKGSVEINPSDKQKEYSTLDFTALFGYSKSFIRSNATHLYTPANFGDPVSGITWVDVPTGSSLNIAGNLVGSGILVISGDVQISGTVQFDGIIYVIGKLTMTGDVNTSGSVLAESSTTVDTTIKGNVTLNWDYDNINSALDNVRMLSRHIVSWKEN